jgi:hypothetical protein
MYLPKDPPMNTKLLILAAWISYYAMRHTADDFWLFCLVYSCVLAACTYFYQQEHKTHEKQNNKKPN